VAPRVATIVGGLAAVLAAAGGLAWSSWPLLAAAVASASAVAWQITTPPRQGPTDSSHAGDPPSG